MDERNRGPDKDIEDSVVFVKVKRERKRENRGDIVEEKTETDRTK